MASNSSDDSGTFGPDPTDLPEWARPEPMPIEEAAESLRVKGPSAEQWVYWRIAASGQTLTDEDKALLESSLDHWWQEEKGRFTKSVKESIHVSLREGIRPEDMTENVLGTLYQKLQLPLAGFRRAEDVLTLLHFLSKEEDKVAAGLRYTTALGALEADKDSDASGIAKDARSALELERELATTIRKFLTDHWWGDYESSGPLGGSTDGNDASSLVDGMLGLDARFATFVEGLGDAGKKLSEKVRDEGIKRASNYLKDHEPEIHRAVRLDLGRKGRAIAEEVRGRTSAAAAFEGLDARREHRETAGPSAFENDIRFTVLAEVWLPWGTSEETGLVPKPVRNLARVLWHDVVRPRLEEAHRKPAAITYAVTADVLDLYSRRYDTRDRDGQQALVFGDSRGWVLVPSIFDDALPALLQKGVGALASETGIDLLEYEVTEAHRQYVAGEPDFRRIVIDGGWSGLAHDKLGLTSKRAAEQVRAIVLAQAHLKFETRGMRGNLLSYSEPERAAPGRKSRVTLTLGDMLLAGFTHTMLEEHGKTSLWSREGRRLVPILGKTALVGRRNDYAAQRRMVWRFAMALRDRAAELADEGSVAMGFADFVALADEAGMPRGAGLVQRVLGAWTTGKTDPKETSASTEPLIRMVGERVTLHESRKQALDFLVSGGEKSSRKRAEGRASAKRRAEGKPGRRRQK